MTRIGLATDAAEVTGQPTPGSLAPYARALGALGEVQLLPSGPALAGAIAASRPDVAFNAARHPLPPADREHVAVAFEAANIPLAGGGSAALAITSSRTRLKDTLGSRRIPTAVATVVQDPSQLAPLGQRSFPLALFRSTGVYTAFDCVVVEDAESLDREARALWSVDPTPLLVERHLTGDVFACVVIGNGEERLLLPPVSIAPRHRATPRVEHVPEGLHQGLERMVLNACLAVGVNDCARVDVALADSGVPQVVAVDPLPDVTGGVENPVLHAADAAGMDDMELIQRWLVLAATRAGLRLPKAPAFDDLRWRTPPRGLRLRSRPA